MSKINGDKARDHLRARKQAKMRAQIRELRSHPPVVEKTPGVVKTTEAHKSSTPK